MALLPRPVSPRSAFADLKAFLAQDRPYKTFVLLSSLLATGLIVYSFFIDTRDIATRKGPEIIYFQNWRADRKTSDILEQLKKDVVRRDAAITNKQKQFQKAADLFGIEWREDQAKNDAVRRQDLKDVMHVLDVRLDKARTEEAAAAAARGKAPAPDVRP